MKRDKPPSALPAARRAYRAANLETLRAKDRDRYRSNPAKTLWAKARQRARLKGVEFAITTGDIHIPTHCPVFGTELRMGSRASHYDAPTLDRIDPARGYTPDNIVVISWRANKIKSDATVEELRRLAEFFLNLAGDPRA